MNKFKQISHILRGRKDSSAFNPQELLNNNFQLVECGYAEVDDEWHKFVSIFPYYRLYLVVDGEAELHLKNSTLKLQKNHLYYIPSFTVVSSKCPNTLIHYYLHFSPKNEMHNFLDFYKPVRSVEATELDVALFKEMLDIFPRTDTAFLIRKNGIFQYLLSKFLDNVECLNIERMRFEPVLKYIDEHLSEHLDIAKLASIINLSEVYFSNLFTKTFGVSPIKYVNNKKMNTAAMMLVENNMNAKEIAYYLGYENEIYFFRLFKKTFGVTPSQYKKELNKHLSK